MRVVVTGASGFIGANLIKTLSQDTQFEVIAVSRQKISTSSKINNYLVDDYQNSPDGDVLIHLAENPNIFKRIISDDDKLVTSLLRGRYDFSIYISSQLMYGDKSEFPHSPSEKVIPYNNYTTNKYNKESQFLSFGGLVVRLANVYGYDMDSSTVISEILSQIPGKGPINIKNESAIRDFIWIEDVGLGLASLLKKPTPGIFNLGTGIGTSIKNIALMCLKNSGDFSRHIVSDKGNSSTIVLDIEKTIKKFNWKPAVTISDGLSRLVRNKL